MYIIIAGSGRVGALLARGLSADGHDVVVIDRDGRAFRNLGNTFNGLTVQGNAIDEDVLKAAGIEQADGFAAATSRDSANIMAAQIAQDLFSVPRVVARVTDPEREPAFREFRLNTVSGTALSAERMAEFLLAPGVHHRAYLGSGEVAIVEFVAGRSGAGLPLAALEAPPRFRLCSVTRTGRTFIPDASFLAEEGDGLAYVVRVEALDELEKLLRTRKGGR